MSLPRDTIQAAEHEAVEVLQRDLRDSFSLLDQAVSALASVLTAYRDYVDITASQAVSHHLLCRLSSDIRCVYILAERGYVKQAHGLVASAYEVTRDVVIIGCDDSLAEEWLSHSDERHRFSASCAQKRFEAGLQRMIDNRSQTAMLLEGSRNFYSQHCMSKHANPKLEQFLAYNPGNKKVQLANGPILTEHSKRVIRQSLVGASAMAALAMSDFILFHIKEDRQNDYLEYPASVFRKISQVRGERYAASADSEV